MSTTITILSRLYSDYCPIVLISETADFGLTSFKFFNSWLLVEGISGACDVDNNKADLRLSKNIGDLQVKSKIGRHI